MARLQLFFGSSEEPLSDAVVPALTTAAHAAHHAMVGGLSLVQMARILGPLVGMMQRACFWAFGVSRRRARPLRLTRSASLRRGDSLRPAENIAQ